MAFVDDIEFGRIHADQYDLYPDDDAAQAQGDAISPRCVLSLSIPIAQLSDDVMAEGDPQEEDKGPLSEL